MNPQSVEAFYDELEKVGGLKEVGQKAWSLVRGGGKQVAQKGGSLTDDLGKQIEAITKQLDDRAIIGLDARKARTARRQLQNQLDEAMGVVKKKKLKPRAPPSASGAAHEVSRSSGSGQARKLLDQAAASKAQAAEQSRLWGSAERTMSQTGPTKGMVGGGKF